jgi:hypothetical protein
MYKWASALACNNMTYSRWVDCHFTTGDTTYALDCFGHTNWGSGPVQWAATNDYNEFVGCTIGGYIRNGGLHVPTKAAGYFDPDSPVLPHNVLPAKR